MIRSRLILLVEDNPAHARSYNGNREFFSYI